VGRKTPSGGKSSNNSANTTENVIETIEPIKIREALSPAKRLAELVEKNFRGTPHAIVEFGMGNYLLRRVISKTLQQVTTMLPSKDIHN
jgi:hypothetical protein